MRTELLRLQTDAITAELAAAQLRAHNIPVAVVADDDLLGASSRATHFSLLVRAVDLDAARKALRTEVEPT
jgi:hypothetical protein